MTGPLQAALSSDIDTLASIYKGQGCRRAGGYTFAEMRMGLETFARFLEPYGIKATLFVVGNDLRHSENHAPLRSMVEMGHEIANHTLTHAQGFRLLAPQAKRAEILGMQELCEQVIGRRPVGFRSPGWNMSDDALPILEELGYLYDSSVFPTSLAPVLKFLHWRTMRSRRGGDRTTLGPWDYMLAPTHPYRTRRDGFGRAGEGGIIEFPITVTPIVRLPLFATFLLATGIGLYKRSIEMLRAFGRPIQFQFHLSDFVEYRHPDLADQVPTPADGVYVPQALRWPLAKKLDLFRRALDILAADYAFCTLEEWANAFQPRHAS